MVDLYLRAGTEDEMIEALPFLRKGNRWMTSEKWAIEIIGSVVMSVKQASNCSGHICETEVDNRFHMNLRCDPSVAAMVPDSIKISPSAPRRTWA